MAGIQRLLMAFEVGVTAGEAELPCFWMMAFMAISWTTVLQGWMAECATGDGWAASVAASTMAHRGLGR
jgi:hypothetical protein